MVRALCWHRAFAHGSERATACEEAAACSLASFEGSLGLPKLFFPTPVDAKVAAI